MKKNSVVIILAFAIFQSGTASADVFKCRTTSGQSVFSDTPCSSGAKVEKARSDESVTYERKFQAMDVNRRNAVQLHSIQMENMIYMESVRAQNAAAERAESIARMEAYRAKVEAARKKSQRIKD